MAAEKEKLQNRMSQLDSRLTAIRAEQDKNSTPNQALVMEAAKIKQEMSPMRGEILLKQQEIDKFVVSMEESPAPEKVKTKTPKTTVPAPAQE
jgi:predicted ribosome quality control (RQC) complex YloA/Tae2 family protein